MNPMTSSVVHHCGATKIKKKRGKTRKIKEKQMKTFSIRFTWNYQ